MENQIVLKSLELRNFKGLKSFTLKMDGNIAISGKNETGKTTLADAYFWLLFDKDSLNQKDFDIKTRENNEHLHGIEHQVEGLFDVNSKELTLKKSYKEKWTKKRGSAEQEMTGHTTDYYIDGVPVAKKEYDEKVNSLMDEETFKLLTNPRHFSENIHWKDRREMLLNLSGDIDDAEIFKANPDLKAVPDILDGQTLDKRKDALKASRKRLNEQIEKIPVRIDEASRSIVEVDGVKGVIEQEIKTLEESKEAKEQEKRDAQNGGAVAELRKQKAALEASLIEEKNEFDRKENEIESKNREKLNKQKTVVMDLEREKEGFVSQVTKTNLEIEQLKKFMDIQRKLWESKNDERFYMGGTCPTCLQQLPKDQIEKAQNNFNVNKSNELARISDEGKIAGESVKNLHKDNEENLIKINDLSDQIKKETETLETIENDESMKNRQGFNSPLTAQIAGLEKQIESANPTEIISKINDEIDKLNNYIQTKRGKLSILDRNAESKARIEELKAEEKLLAGEYEKVEADLFLLEQYEKARAEIVETHVNKSFKFTKFKLFNQLQNGGIEACCEVVVDGVPYNSINNANRINSGLDISNTFSNHLGITAPIFIDNAESVNDVFETESQQIRLYVGNEKKMTILNKN